MNVGETRLFSHAKSNVQGVTDNEISVLPDAMIKECGGQILSVALPVKYEIACLQVVKL